MYYTTKKLHYNCFKQLFDSYNYIQHSMRAKVSINYFDDEKAALTLLTATLLFVALLGRSRADYQRTVSYEGEVVVRW